MIELRQDCKDVLNYIKQHIEEHGYPPSMPEIGEAFEMSRRMVRQRVDTLKALGFLRTRQGAARGIELIEQPEARRQSSPRHGRQLNKARRLCSREFCTNERAPHSQWCSKCEREFVSRCDHSPR